MYAIIVYDVSTERVAKVCQFLRKFMNWVQNSVFEGEVTKSELERIRRGLEERIDKTQDFVIFYVLRTDDLLKRDIMGIEKSKTGNVI
jgi:CRISPR-associated protein Cas2